MDKADKEIAVVTHEQMHVEPIEGWEVVKSADEIAREHYNVNNPKAVVKSTIKVDNTLDAPAKKEEPQKNRSKKLMIGKNRFNNYVWTRRTPMDYTKKLKNTKIQLTIHGLKKKVT